MEAKDANVTEAANESLLIMRFVFLASRTK